MRGLFAVLLLGAPGCAGTGTWEVETRGLDTIEHPIPAERFADGCAAAYDTFVLVESDIALVDGDGDTVGGIPGARAWDLTQPGPHEVGSVDVTATYYDHVQWRLGPSPAVQGGNPSPDQLQILGEQASLVVGGMLTCPGGEVAFSWTFDTDASYDCAPGGLTIPAGGSNGTEISLSGEHLFYDGLENADAVLRGEAIVDADADQDGSVTPEELSTVSVANLGYDVGSQFEVATLYEFIAHLTRTLAHVDGDGNCAERP